MPSAPWYLALLAGVGCSAVARVEAPAAAPEAYVLPLDREPPARAHERFLQERKHRAPPFDQAWREARVRIGLLEQLAAREPASADFAREKISELRRLADERAAATVYAEPPYAPAARVAEVNDVGVDGTIRGWVPADDVADAARHEREWSERAAAGTTFDCDGDRCHLVVAVTNEAGTLSGLATCRTAVVDDALGVPEECTALLLRDAERTWIRATVGRTTPPVYGAMTVDSLDLSTPVLTLKLGSDVRRARVIDALKAALASRPLLLRVEHEETEDDGDNLLGVKQSGLSEILDPWFEKVTVNVPVRFEANGDDDEPRLPTVARVYAVAQLYVSRQNTNQNSAWRMPEEADSEAWQAALKDVIRNEVARICTRLERTDDSHVTCW